MPDLDLTGARMLTLNADTDLEYVGALALVFGCFVIVFAVVVWEFYKLRLSISAHSEGMQTFQIFRMRQGKQVNRIIRICIWLFLICILVYAIFSMINDEGFIRIGYSDKGVLIDYGFNESPFVIEWDNVHSVSIVQNNRGTNQWIEVVEVKAGTHKSIVASNKQQINTLRDAVLTMQSVMAAMNAEDRKPDSQTL